MATWECSGCALEVDRDPPKRCPECGQPFRQRRSKRKPEMSDGRFTYSIGVALCRCDSPTCGHEFLLDPSHACPRCGEPVVEGEPDDEQWQARHRTYGPRLAELQARAEAWNPVSVQFRDRGPRADASDHATLISASMERVTHSIAEAERIFEAAQWSEPDREDTSRALDQLVASCDDIGALVEELASTPPPLLLLAIHRQATRSIALAAEALVGFAALLDARYYVEARNQQLAAQGKLDVAAEKISHVSQLIERVERVLWAPGFWAIEDEYDTGRVSWEGVDAQISTITSAADVVRETFGEVPGILDLPDEQALMLMPAAAIGASFQDPERLVQRARECRQAIDAASEAGDWVEEPMALLDLVWRGQRQLTDQVVRIGHELRVDTPRKLLLQTALDVYSKLLEGPLRSLGAVVAVAMDYLVDQTCLEAATGDAYPARRVMKALNRDSNVLDGVDVLMRNAEAHYDFTITEAGVDVRHLPPGKAAVPLVDSLTDEDFFEQLLNLDEALVAIELAVIPFLWSIDHAGVQQELEIRSGSWESRCELLRALAGLKGWTDLTLVKEGVVLAIGGTYRGPESADPVVELLPVIAAALVEEPAIDRVVVAAAQHEVEVERSDFPVPHDVGPVRSHKVGLLLFRLHEEGDARPVGVRQANDYLVLGTFLTLEALAVLADQTDDASATTLERYARWLLAIVRAEPWDSDVRDMAAEFTSVLVALVQALGAFKVACRRGSPKLAQRATSRMGKLAAELEPLHQRARLAAGLDGHNQLEPGDPASE